MPSTTSPPTQNPFLLAADASPALLPLLRSNPALATQQDASGYSLLHALVSYAHISLLRDFVREFRPPLSLRDEDGETALFVAESVAAARCLVEELGGGGELVALKNHEGLTAEEKMRAEIEEGDAEEGVAAVAEYLAEYTKNKGGKGTEEKEDSGESAPPPLPKNMTLNVGTMSADDPPAEVDEELRRRIEQLAARDDFAGEGGQAELRTLVEDAVKGMGGEEREVRRRVD